MTKKALIIGGTGPSGPFIIEGLINRGYEPVVLHRGTHEVQSVGDLEHIHADPYVRESLQQGLGRRSFDLAIVTYGKTRFVVELLSGHTDRLINVGGNAYQFPLSRPAKESDPLLTEPEHRRRIVNAELELLEAHRQGVFNVTCFRYPNLYGPRQLAPREWCIIRRIMDGRRQIPMLDGGLTLEGRLYVENAAHGVLLGVDNPEKSSGQVYSIADEHPPSDADRVNVIAEIMGVEVELVPFPAQVAGPASFWAVGRDLKWALTGGIPPSGHKLFDTGKIRQELSYIDIVNFRKAMQTTVRWYLDNPPERGGEVETQIGDPFDYAAEDAYFHEYGNFLRALRGVKFGGFGYKKHPYPDFP